MHMYALAFTWIDSMVVDKYVMIKLLSLCFSLFIGMLQSRPAVT